MPRAIKTYGWTAMIYDKVLRKRLGMAEHHIQCRAIVATTSMAAVARLVGGVRPRHLYNLCETGNAREKAIAEQNIGQIYVATLNGPRDYIEYDVHLNGRLA